MMQRLVLANLGLLLATLLVGCSEDQLPQLSVDLASVEEIRDSLESESAGGGGAVVEEELGTGWATIKGKFSLAEGASVRQPQPLQITTNVDVCAPGGRPVYDQKLVINDENRGVANVVIFLRNARRVHESAKASGEEVEFDQKQCVFLSHVAAMTVGQTLEIKNSDGFGHNTNIQTREGAGFNKIIPANQSLAFAPTAAEPLPVPVSCTIHPWMQAYLMPHENGYIAVTDENGEFTIENVPAGEELEFQVWHESGAGRANALPLDRTEIAGSSSGRFKLKLNENETKSLTVTLPDSAFQG